MRRRVLPSSAIGWVFFAFLVHGVCLRLLALPTALKKWANAHQKSVFTVVVGLSVGALEDACVAIATCILLWSIGFSKLATSSKPRASLAASLFLCCNVLLCVDLVFLRTRQMRFRWDFVLLYWRERRTDAWRQLQVEDTEWILASQMVGVTLVFTALLWRQLTDRLVWVASPLSEWDELLRRRATAPTKCSHRSASSTAYSDNADTDAIADNAALLADEKPTKSIFVVRLSRIVLLWGVGVGLTVGITKLTPSAIAMIAWNSALCEPLRQVVGVECTASRSPTPTLRNLRQLLDTETENCSFLSENTAFLVRKTHNFVGPLAFDVAIEPNEKPNVLLVVVESFRAQDSRYLLHPDHVNRFLPRNMSLTPHFDRWAKRGVGFRNMWSTWRTSRSLEQLLFAQLPLDSATDSGTTTGRKHVQLSGLPQLFQAKGYDTLFTTGSRLDYDDWDVFLPSHGFDKALNGWDLAHIGEKEMGIDWTEGDRMMAFWGIHDDLTFDVLAHLLKQRQARKKTNKGAKPFFATHFTISSHVPFDERPDWYYRMRERGDFPEFSPLYAAIEDEEIRELVQNYAEMRYFTDLCFGLFMDELQRSGVLNDTIVMVTADHGHAPERGVAMPEEDQVSAMHIPAALIAEGRLGQYAGTTIDEPAAQYDWLNTIADVVGVPKEGFVQTGIGRSLKRKWTSTEKQRVVFSNNPALNLAAVQGQTRIEFFADVEDVMRVFNVERDPERQQDLVGDLPRHRLHEIQRICDEGRAMNAYFTQRWRENCLLPPTCEPDAV